MSLLTLLIFYSAQAKSQTKRTIHRIDLKQKANLYLQSAVEELLEANCRGDITAYYPKAPDVKVEFSTLANYFYLELNKPINEGYFITNCCNNNLCDLSKNNIENFLGYIEVVEDYIKTSNGYQREVLYIRLLNSVYDANGGFIGIEKGPLFHFKEVKEAFLSIKNPKNSTKIALSLVFDGHLYSDNIVNSEQKYLSLKESKKYLKKRRKNDDDIWVK